MPLFEVSVRGCFSTKGHVDAVCKVLLLTFKTVVRYNSIGGMLDVPGAKASDDVSSL